MLAADFDFHLPEELIAQSPAPLRPHSRLLLLRRQDQSIEHCAFPELLNLLREGDVLVLNDSKVIPARLRGRNPLSEGRFEILLLGENGANDWWAMMKPGKRARVGTVILLQNVEGAPTELKATVLEVNSEGHRRLVFSGTQNILEVLDIMGEIPLPPYIHRCGNEHASLDRERYQTVYARTAGSIAAPTAGLHFTEELLDRARAMGVKICFVTLHVGLGTFVPVKEERAADHVMHSERYEISAETAEIIETARRERRRIIAVGTTTVRVLESVAVESRGCIQPRSGSTNIFIYPPRPFAVVNALLTNFHLPRSTLLMLVSAFCAPGSTRGRELALHAYSEAVRLRYRFFSYGDAMLIL